MRTWMDFEGIMLNEISQTKKEGGESVSLWGDLGRTFQAKGTTSTEALRWSEPGMFTD